MLYFFIEFEYKKKDENLANSYSFSFFVDRSFLLDISYGWSIENYLLKNGSKCSRRYKLSPATLPTS